MTRSALFALAPALAAALAPAAAAQTLVQDQIEHLAVELGAVPGLAGGEQFSSFDSAVVDDGGNVLFRGRFFGGSATSTTDRAYFLGADQQSLTMILRSGDPEPSGTIPGATLNSTSAGLSSSARISGNGTILFGSSLNDGGVTIDTTNDSALFHGTPGNFQVLAREGDPAPGTVGATFKQSFTSLSHQQTGLNSNGTALFKATLEGGDVTGTANDTAWFVGTPGNLSILVREGDALFDGQVVDRVSPSFISQMNAADLILVDVSYVVGSGPGPVADSDDRALVLGTPGGLFELVREGNPSPYLNTDFSEPTQFNWTASTSGNAFNAQGEVLINGKLDGGVGDSAIVKLSLLGDIGIMRVGDPVPGVPGAIFGGFNNSSLRLAQDGRVSFQGFFSGAGITEFNDTAQFVGFPGAFELVAREGDVAPGTGGQTWRSINGISSYLNNVGQLVFSPSVTVDPSTGPTTSGSWYFDPTDGLRQVFLSDGTLIDLGNGIFESATSAGGVQFGNGSSRSLSFMDDGTAVFRMNYTGGMSSVSKVRAERLAASPDTISELAGGVYELKSSGGTSRAGELFLLLGSLGGTAPGLTLDGVNLPLNVDAFLLYSLDSANTPPFGNTFSFLDDLGRATSTVTVPAGSTGLAGLGIDFAWLSIGLVPVPVVTAASNAVHLDLVP